MSSANNPDLTLLWRASTECLYSESGSWDFTVKKGNTVFIQLPKGLQIRWEGDLSGFPDKPQQPGTFTPNDPSETNTVSWPTSQLQGEGPYTFDVWLGNNSLQPLNYCGGGADRPSMTVEP